MRLNRSKLLRKIDMSNVSIPGYGRIRQDVQSRCDHSILMATISALDLAASEKSCLAFVCDRLSLELPPLDCRNVCEVKVGDLANSLGDSQLQVKEILENLLQSGYLCKAPYGYAGYGVGKVLAAALQVAKLEYIIDQKGAKKTKPVLRDLYDKLEMAQKELDGLEKQSRLH